MVVTLSPTLSLYYKSYFPYHNRRTIKKGYRVLVGIGGNIGDSINRFQKLFLRMERDNNIQIISTSPILKNPPFGYLEQDDFFNGLILIETKLYPLKFLNKILYLEKRFGRKRTFKNAPRTLDIDIIFFDNFIIKTPSLNIPHRDWQNRDSVVIPLINLENSYYV